MKRATIPVLLAVLSVFACGGAPARPNVLLIIVDTLRWDHLSCYGSRAVRTPNIDRLAARGVRFESAFTQAPFTLPSITTMMTGLYPYRHQVRNNQTNLADEFTTLAEIMQEAGYATGAVLGSAVLESARNLTQGFDHYEDDYPGSLAVFDPRLRRRGVMHAGDRGQRRANDVTDLSLSWIDTQENTDAPFFLLAHYFDPHSQYDPPPPWNSRYPGRAYEGEVAFTDAEIGRLLTGLELRGIHENTLVVFVADHGEARNDHGEAEHGFFVYDATIRVPLIVSQPGRLPAGVVAKPFVRTVDILPTVCDLVDVALDTRDKIDGRSFAAVSLLDDAPAAYEPEPIYSEAFLGYFAYGWAPTRAIRTPEWKLVGAPKPELYHMTTDPGELTNVYEREPGVAGDLEAVLRAHLRAESEMDPVDVETGDIGEAQKERLEALGYLTSNRKTPDTNTWDDLPDPKDAIAAFQKRQEAKVMVGTSRPYLQAGRYDEGRSIIEAALDLSPGLPIAYQYIATSYMLEKRWDDAAEVFRRLIDMEWQAEANRGELSVALINGGRMGEAAEQIRIGLASNPGNSRLQVLDDAVRTARETGKSVSIAYTTDMMNQ